MTRSPSHRLPLAVTGLALGLALAGNGLGTTASLVAAAQQTPLLPTALVADALPGGAVVTAKAVTGLACSSLLSLRLCTHGDDTALQPRATTAAGEKGTQASTSSTRIGCYGDGTSGPRIITAYVRPVGSADRYAQYVDRFRGWAGALETSVDDSAHQTKGARHVRFATTAGTGCSLRILRLTLPGDAFRSFASTVQALQDQGFDHAGSKYLLWTDASGYCGVASTYDDDKPTSDNFNNGRLPTYARVDRTCWGYAEAHEVMHMLGGISPHAPHGTAGYHCNDGAELMCYDDGSARSTQHAVCGSSHARLFDCRSDDYFSTAPARGSWLAKHWNVATSSFLSPAWSEATTAPPGPSPEPSATAASGDAAAGADQPSPAPQPVVSLPPLHLARG
jgi:hypothetical protein